VGEGEPEGDQRGSKGRAEHNKVWPRATTVTQRARSLTHQNKATHPLEAPWAQNKQKLNTRLFIISTPSLNRVLPRARTCHAMPLASHT